MASRLAEFMIGTTLPRLVVKTGTRLWFWLAQSKEQLSALQSLAAIFALVVGACWVLIHFDILSELIAEVSLARLRLRPTRRVDFVAPIAGS
jgi:hypothetical protein